MKQRTTLAKHRWRAINWTAICRMLLLVALCLPASGVHAQPVDQARAHPALLQLAAEHPDDTFMVIIQREENNQDRKDDSAEQAVGRAGGRVTKQLQMIESFAAELTGKEIEALALHPQVRWITIDAPLVSTADDAPPMALAAVGRVYTVTNTNNSGAGSLRQAITDANGNAGTDTIQFNIPLTDANHVYYRNNGVAGAFGAPVTTTQADGAISDFDPDYLAGTARSWYRISLSGADLNVTQGVIIDGSTQPGYNPAKGPIIELNATSISSGDPNGLTLTTGASTVKALVINRAGDDSIEIDVGAGGSTIIGNYLGTDVSGLQTTFGNGYGITIKSDANRIGGTNAADRNVIGGNSKLASLSFGIGFWQDADNNIVQGNYLGVGANGTTAMGNRQGITFQGTPHANLIGGTVVGAGNIIANNSMNGVDVIAGTGNALLNNAIHSNTLLGINLSSAGVTTNNGAKNSSLSNYGMDFPVITAASLSYCSLTVAGYVGSAANQSTFANARVEFFKSAVDSSGYGEGQTFLGSLTTDANGNFSGIVSAIGFNAGDRLTATATDSSNNTSEFGPNFQVTTTTGSCVASSFAKVVRVDQLPSNLQGQGVTVAVVDSGITPHGNLQGRIVANNNQTTAPDANDNYVHGTFVAGIIGGAGRNAGIAPNVNVVNVKVSNDVGNGTLSDLIDGLQWILTNKDAYNIKVVNISLNSTVPESYHSSPLSAAVEILWFNGITVVVAAGNNGAGNEPVTLYPPANDPFVITVGAADDKGTPALSDDSIALFSAYGTTENSFAKPDLVAPGRNLISLLPGTSAYGYINHPVHRVDTSYFRMSGTSMAAPVVSGAIALLLQDEPNLTPDQVKYRLKATANTAWPGYDAAKSGAGYLDAYAAVNGTTTESANTGLTASQLLTTGSEPINSSVSWNSVSWNSVSWNSVSWNSVSWNTVSWNSVSWNAVSWGSGIWDDMLMNRLFLPLANVNSRMENDLITELTHSTDVTGIVDKPTDQVAEAVMNRLFLPLVNQE